MAKGATVKEQTTAILKQIDALLAAGGHGQNEAAVRDHLARRHRDFAEMNSVWDAWVSPGNTPARACVESKLVAPEYAVEIACICAV